VLVRWLIYIFNVPVYPYSPAARKSLSVLAWPLIDSIRPVFLFNSRVPLMMRLMSANTGPTKCPIFLLTMPETHFSRYQCPVSWWFARIIKIIKQGNFSIKLFLHHYLVSRQFIHLTNLKMYCYDGFWFKPSETPSFYSVGQKKEKSPVLHHLSHIPSSAMFSFQSYRIIRR
jgi:hypothetical protein